ncbi:hypothetical protein ACQKK2_18980 [Bacillus paranthracis]|uniref:hypothetical protein n=1 Tax=Bacillus paranthracis TaxID=2026186 RepID=UPI003D03C4A4
MSLSLFVGKSIFFVESTIYLKNRRYSAGNRRYIEKIDDIISFTVLIDLLKRAIQKELPFLCL